MSTDRNTPLLAALVVAAGLIGGWVAVTLGSPDASSEPQASLPATTYSNADWSDTSESVDTLTRSVEALQVEMDLLRADLDRGLRSAPKDAEIPAGSSRRVLAAPPSESPAPAEVDVAQVNAILDQREERESAERRERAAERSQGRIDRQMNQWRDTLGLNDAQTHDMGLILAEASSKRSEMFSELRNSGDWDRDAMRSSMTSMQEQTNTSLAGILNSTQMDTYLFEQENQRGGWGGWGGGRSGRGGRGGGDQPF